MSPLRERLSRSVHGSGQSERWDVYVVRAVNGALYTGIARDADRRFSEHAAGRGAKFFRVSAAREMVFREPHASRAEALRREAQIKHMSRAEKLEMIEQSIDGRSGRRR